MKKSIIFLAAIAAFFSCAKDNSVNNTTAEKTFSVTLTASAPTSEDAPSPASADTKTTLVDGPVVDGKPSKFVHWSQKDAIKVLFFPKTTEVNASFSGPSYEFESNVTAAASAVADFSCASWSWPDKVTEFGISKTLMTKGIAVYPSSAVATSTKPLDKYVYCDTEISFLLPSSQNAVENNIETRLNFSWAEIGLSDFEAAIVDKTTPHLRFNNACAIVELTMPSTLDKKVTSISLVSNSGVSLTGKGSVKLIKNYQNIVAEPFGVDITDGDGVTLLSNADGFKAGAKYYAVVWPGKHDSGLTIEFKAEDGTVATKTTPTVTLTASKIKPYTFNKGLVFESKNYDYVYSDGKFGNEVKDNIIGVVIYNGAPQDIDSGIPSKFSNGVAVFVDQHTTQWQSSAQIATSTFTSAGVQLAGNTSKSSVGGYTAKENLQALNSSYLALYKGMPSFSYSFATDLYVGTTKEWDIIAADMERINKLLGDAGKTTISGNYWTANVSSKFYSYYTTGNGSYVSGSTTYNLTVIPIFAF